MRKILPISVLLALAAPAAAQEVTDCTPDVVARIERDSAQERAWRERVGQLRAAITAEAPGDTAGFVVLEVDSATQRARVAGELIRPLAGVLPDHTRHFRVGVRPMEDRPWCTLPGEPPEMRNQSIVTRRILQVASEYRQRNSGSIGGTRGIVVKMLVTAEGRPALVLLQEFTGDEWLDQTLGETARSLRFQPARIGNAPMDVWVTLPLTITDEPPGST